MDAKSCPSIFASCAPCFSLSTEGIPIGKSYRGDESVGFHALNVWNSDACMFAGKICSLILPEYMVDSGKVYVFLVVFCLSLLRFLDQYHFSITFSHQVLIDLSSTSSYLVSWCTRIYFDIDEGRNADTAYMRLHQGISDIGVLES